MASGEEYKLSIALPGRINYVNSAMALAAVSAMGISPHEAVERFKQVRSVAGRYRVLDIYGCQVRILLAKNPASWARTMQLLQEGGAFESRSLLLILNARAIDGLDPSWIWDVDFSGFDGATLFVTGERALDMALRLDVAGLPFHIVASVREACARAPGGHLEIVANYSGFVDLIKECQRLNVW